MVPPAILSPSFSFTVLRGGRDHEDSWSSPETFCLRTVSQYKLSCSNIQPHFHIFTPCLTPRLVLSSSDPCWRRLPQESLTCATFWKLGCDATNFPISRSSFWNVVSLPPAPPLLWSGWSLDAPIALTPWLAAAATCLGGFRCDPLSLQSASESGSVPSLEDRVISSHSLIRWSYDRGPECKPKCLRLPISLHLMILDPLSCTNVVSRFPINIWSIPHKTEVWLHHHLPHLHHRILQHVTKTKTAIVSQLYELPTGVSIYLINPVMLELSATNTTFLSKLYIYLQMGNACTSRIQKTNTTTLSQLCYIYVEIGNAWQIFQKITLLCHSYLSAKFQIWVTATLGKQKPVPCDSYLSAKYGCT